MKFLIVVHYFSPHIGGMEEVAKRQVESLVTRGHDVTVVTCRSDSQLPAQTTEHGYTIKRVPALNFIENKYGVTFPIISPLKFWWWLTEVEKYDYVHIHDVFYMSSHFAALASILRGKQFFLTQHVAMVDHPNKLVMFVEHIVYHTFGRLIFRRAAKIVCYNQIVKKFLGSHGVPEQNILQQYNGVDVEYFSPVTAAEKHALRTKYNLPLERPIVLFVGRLVPKKGFSLLYEAQSPHYLSLIVGNGKIPASMPPTPDSLFFGPASSGQLRDLYRSSDMFVFPAIGEIFTLVMQEAMACALPTIVADDPGYKDYDFSRQNMPLIPREASAIRKTIEQLLASPKKLQEMSSYARRFAEQNFSWQKNYTTETTIYNTKGAENAG